MPRLCFLGDSHAAHHLREAARGKGMTIVDIQSDPDVVFVSQDTPILEGGYRDVQPIRNLCRSAEHLFRGPIVVTSQVPPGFTREVGRGRFYHQVDTLRIRDAAERAANPEAIVVGVPFGYSIPLVYQDYLDAFHCPVLRMGLEDAEFSKIAFNMMLAAQVDQTNRLAAAAVKCGVDWNNVAEVLRYDSRIGPNAYLEPGRWQDSEHLMRDYRTLQEIEAR